MRVGLMQMAVVDGDALANLKRADAMLGGAPSADVYLMPELWTSGYDHEKWGGIADDHTPIALQWMRDAAASRSATVGGSLISRNDLGQLVNRFWLVNGNGVLASYDKGHLFAPLHEDQHLAAGRSRVRFALDGWTAALTICFDLRFPEQYRLDAVDGAEMFLVSSSWPHPRCAVMEALARARAIENQAVLALCNRVGRGSPDMAYCGGSVVVAPDGAILATAGAEECVVVATIDRSAVEAARAVLPVLPLRSAGLDW